MPPSHQYYHIQNSLDGNAYRKWAKSYGDHVYQLVCKVIDSFDYEQQSYNSCNGILHTCKQYPKTYCDIAAEECLEHHTISYSYFKRALEGISKRFNVNEHPNTVPEQSIPQHQNIRGKSNYE